MVALLAQMPGWTTLVPEWGGLAFGLLGTILAIAALVENHRNRNETKALKVRQLVYEAWDLLGGQPGSSVIWQPAQNPATTELVRRLLSDALVIEPDSAEAHAAIGASFALSGRPEEAIAACRRAFELDPRISGFAHGYIGNAQQALGNYPESADAYREALEWFPSSVLLMTELAKVLELSGEVEEAALVQQRIQDLSR